MTYSVMMWTNVGGRINANSSPRLSSQRNATAERAYEPLGSLSVRRPDLFGAALLHVASSNPVRNSMQLLNSVSMVGRTTFINMGHAGTHLAD